MYIKKFGVKNWCQWSNTEIDLVAGVNGVIGQNGGGKSNFVEGIMFLLTGRTVKNGQLAENIRHGYKKAELWIEFCHNDSTFRLERSITRTKHNAAMSCEDDETYNVSGAKEVNASIERLFGIPRQFLENHSFVSQGQLRDLVKGLPSERMDLFISMLPLVGPAESIRAQLTAELGKTPLVTLPFDDNMLGTERTNAEVAKLAADKKVAGLNTDLAAINVDDHKAVVLEWNKAQATQQVQTQLSTAKEEVSRVREQLSTAKEAAGLRLFGIKAVADGLDHTALQHANYQWATASQYSEPYHRLTQEVTQRPDLTETEGRLAEAAKGVQDWQVAVNAATAALQVKQAELQKLSRKDGMSECPTCGSVVDQAVVAQEKATITAEVEKLSATLQEHTKGLNDARTSSSSLQKYIQDTNREWDRKQSELDQYTNWYAANPFPTIPQQVVEEAVRDQQELTRLTQQNAANNEVGRLESDLVRRTKVVSDLEDRLAAAAADNTDSNVTLDEYNVSQRKIEEWANIRQQLTQANAELTAAEQAISTVTSKEGDQDKARKLQKRVDDYRNRIDHSIRSLHRDMYPRRVLDPFLNAFQVYTNRYVESFNRPFALDFDEKLAAKVTLPTGFTMNITGLSGAQESIAAVAQRLAIFDIFCRGFGLMIMDEPSESMSAENAELLGEVILDANSAGGYARQMVVITHHEPMHRSFERTFRVVADGSSATMETD